MRCDDVFRLRCARTHPGLGTDAVGASSGTPVEVAVDNRSGERIAMTVSQGAQLGPSMVVGACEASSFIYPIEGPFTVGVGNATDFSERPMPPLVESSRLEKDRWRVPPADPHRRRRRRDFWAAGRGRSDARRRLLIA